MCGIFGVAAVGNHEVGLSDADAVRLRDRMRHRGPDGAGLWRSGCGRFLLAHRRLAVLDLTDAGRQPMVTASPASDPGRSGWAIAYNGELYNDPELRRELAATGRRFRSTCDAETVLAALEAWGSGAIDRFRGMFALAAIDLASGRLVLARDPLGIKPLYYWTDGRTIVFASEPAAILGHPDVAVRPDPVTVSAYLTTIRTTLGERTLFAGVRSVQPGEVIEWTIGGVAEQRRVEIVVPGMQSGGPLDESTDVRSAIVDSVRRHLRADVPACSLLSGGLDSSIIVAVCRELGVEQLRTYASGHDDPSVQTDLWFARQVGAAFGTVHSEVPITRELFRERWPDMVRRQGVPLSTPNEVAINEVARRLRADGQVVTLSGEGADELFAGYELPMMQAWEFEQQSARAGGGAPARDGGQFQLRASAWVPPEAKPAVLSEPARRQAEHDAMLTAWYSDRFAALDARLGGLQTHLAFHRSVNLAGLLQRLDTATMLEGVEGRTPFADREVATLAESLPMHRKFAPGRTKIALREAFSGVLPHEVVERPKASFPLPFQGWVADHAAILRSSSFARQFFTPEAIGAVCADPARAWHLAWPMINLAMWAKCWDF